MIRHSLTQQDYQRIAGGYDHNPAAAMSLMPRPIPIQRGLRWSKMPFSPNRGSGFAT